jgi:hypothetical protein
VARWFSNSKRDRAHRTRRSMSRVVAAGIAIAAAGTVSAATVSAHRIVSTTPAPSHGVVGRTALADTALVDADSSRHVAFSLWAPNTCGTEGAAPVFTDNEAVTTSSLTNSTVTSASFVPKKAGVYEWTAEVIVNSDGSVENGPTACADEQVTVDKVATHLATTPSNADGALVGSSIRDSATLTGGVNATGTVTFFLYGPDNAACVNGDIGSQTWLQRWVVQLSGDGTASVPAPGFTTMATGTYNWVASYGGDSSNMPAHSACGAESVVMGKALPTIVTAASKGGPVGTQIHDTAQVSGGVNPTGTVTFSLFSPSNPTCSIGEGSTGSVQTVTVPLGTDGSASSAAMPYTTVEVGTYNWIAKYSGDANNKSVSTACTDEQVTVGKDPTSVTTAASAGGAPGITLHDTAKVTGRLQPTGTVTFTLYGPTDTTCTAAPLFTSTGALAANGTATSAGFSGTTAAGTYNWIASYSGDARSAASKSKCGAEPVSITASGVKGITTPGTGLDSSITQVGLGIELLLGGLALFLGGELIKGTKRA